MTGIHRMNGFVTIPSFITLEIYRVFPENRVKSKDLI